MNLDDELKSALKRRAPPAGFTDRVMARARMTPAGSTSPWRRKLALLFSLRTLEWATACAMATVLLVGAGAEYRRRQEGERAKEQVVFALRMAGSRLSFAQRMVLEMSSGRTAAPARKPSVGEGEQ
jgi:hypothetical protein